MKCPCEECLCIPICQSRGYLVLTECSLLEKYLIKPFNFKIRPPDHLLKVEEILNPISWGKLL